MQNEKSICCGAEKQFDILEHRYICSDCGKPFIPSKNPMEEDKAEEHTCYDIPCVACNNLNQEECPREKYRKGYCEIKGCPYQHQSNQEDKNKECEQWNHDICTSPTCPLYPSKDIEDLENGRVLEKWNNQEDKSSLKNIDANVGTYEKIVEPIQEDKDWEDGIKSKIFNIVAKLDNGSHSSNQLQGIDEALFELIKKTKQESYEEGREYERNKLLKDIRVSWDIADGGNEWCVIIWNGNTILDSLSKKSDDGGCVRLLELLQNNE